MCYAGREEEEEVVHGDSAGGGGFAFQSDVDNGRKIWRDGMEGVFLRYMRMTVACVPELWSVFPRGTVVESGEQCFFMR